MATGMRLAIVGSTLFANDQNTIDDAMRCVDEVIERYAPDVVISGGADGIDFWAAFSARSRGIEVIEHFPASNRWKPNGYQDRNLLIAADCDQLVCIRHRAATSYGSGWTADQAEAMGKPVERIVIG